MDPVGHIAWRNRADSNMGTAHMVRDALTAADAMHQAAMSGMDANIGDEGEFGGNIESVGDETAPLATDDSAEPGPLATDDNTEPECSRHIDVEVDPVVDGEYP